MKTILAAVTIALAACTAAQAGTVLQGAKFNGVTMQGAKFNGTSVGSTAIGSSNLAGIELPR